MGRTKESKGHTGANKKEKPKPFANFKIKKVKKVKPSSNTKGNQEDKVTEVKTKNINFLGKNKNDSGDTSGRKKGANKFSFGLREKKVKGTNEGATEKKEKQPKSKKMGFSGKRKIKKENAKKKGGKPSKMADVKVKLGTMICFKKRKGITKPRIINKKKDKNNKGFGRYFESVGNLANLASETEGSEISKSQGQRHEEMGKATNGRKNKLCGAPVTALWSLCFCTNLKSLRGKQKKIKEKRYNNAKKQKAKRTNNPNEKTEENENCIKSNEDKKPKDKTEKESESRKPENFYSLEWVKSKLPDMSSSSAVLDQVKKNTKLHRAKNKSKNSPDRNDALDKAHENNSDKNEGRSFAARLILGKETKKRHAEGEIEGETNVNDGERIANHGSETCRNEEGQLSTPNEVEEALIPRLCPIPKTENMKNENNYDLENAAFKADEYTKRVMLNQMDMVKAAKKQMTSNKQAKLEKKEEKMRRKSIKQLEKIKAAEEKQARKSGRPMLPIGSLPISEGTLEDDSSDAKRLTSNGKSDMNSNELAVSAVLRPTDLLGQRTNIENMTEDNVLTKGPIATADQVQVKMPSIVTENENLTEFHQKLSIEPILDISQDLTSFKAANAEEEEFDIDIPFKSKSDIGKKPTVQGILNVSRPVESISDLISAPSIIPLDTEKPFERTEVTKANSESAGILATVASFASKIMTIIGWPIFGDQALPNIESPVQT